MISRILLAVDDSPAAVAASAAAMELAEMSGATVRAMTVVSNHQVTDRLPAAGGDEAAGRMQRSAATVLRQVAALALRAAVPVDTVQLAGEPAPCILDQAHAWAADLIVVGRAGTSGAGQPYIGGQTRHVLEFAEVPVLVVPAASLTGAGRRTPVASTNVPG